MRLFTANGAHMSCTGSVSAWSDVGATHVADGIGAKSRPELLGPTRIASSAEAVYYGTGHFRVRRTTSYTEKP